MATVVLPLGYPILSGNEFSTVVYQGNVARQYVVSVDPRSGAQLESRHFLSDVSKVRGTLGKWGKAALKTALGSKWSSQYWQIVKADIEGWWSDALSEWSDFGETHKQEWRDASPYQLTFNDIGEMWFANVRIVYRVLMFFKGIAYGAELWAEDESADALTWWQKEIGDALGKGLIDVVTNQVTWPHGYDLIADGAAGAGYYTKNAGYGGSVCEFYVNARYLTWQYLKGSGYSTCDVYVDGELVETINLYNASTTYGNYWAYDMGVKSLHFISFVTPSDEMNVDYFNIS